MLNNKTVLITGGTGSFGKQFTKTIQNMFIIHLLKHFNTLFQCFFVRNT